VINGIDRPARLFVAGGLAGELAQALSPGARLHVGRHMEVALGQAVPHHASSCNQAWALGDPRHGDLGRAQAVNLAPLCQGQMSIGQGSYSLRECGPCACNSIRTSD
jgi:hypothetical protein